MKADEIKQITARVRQKILALNSELESKRLFFNKKISDFKNVVLVVGSSRGGTSLFFDTLRHHPDFSSSDGEHGKYYTLCNICYPFYDSDYIPRDTDYNQHGLPYFMLMDVGRTDTTGTEELHYIENFISRLPMQFYYRNFDYQDIAREYLDNHRNFTEIVDRAGIMKRYYDLKSVGLENSEAFNPLSDFYIAETPFVFPHRNKRSLQEKDFTDSTLLLKTSVDAYRIPWVKSIFNQSNVKIVHLTRNPASAMNGLIDGWKTNRGFFTYSIPELEIKDYDRWDLWNYDLPPTWPSLKKNHLLSVVWEQWSQAHKYIIETTRRDKEEVLRVKFEEFIENRQEVLTQVLQFAGLDSQDSFFQEHTRNLNEVMTTKKPRKYRWKDREQEILTTLNDQDLSLLETLDYKDRSQWI